MARSVFIPPWWLAQSDGSWKRHGYPLVAVPDVKWRLLQLLGETAGETTESFVAGVTKPDATNTGVPGGTAGLELITGSASGVYAPAPGTYVYGREIRNFVDAADGVVFENCWIRGRAPGGSFRSALITGTGTGVGAQFIRCTIAPQAAAGTYYMNGIGGSRVSTNRCNLYNCVDTWHTSGTRISDVGSWSHHMAAYLWAGTTLGGPGAVGTGDQANDSRWPGMTHNDHFQGLGGGSHSFLGTRMDGYIAHNDPARSNHPGWIPDACGNWEAFYNDTTRGFGWSAGAYAGMWGSCFAITPQSAVVTGSITKCWLDGTEVLFQLPFQGGTRPASGNNWNISGNRLGLPHPYALGKRFEQMRMTAGMGTITISERNSYGDFPSVTGLVGTPTTSPAPVPGNGVAGTLNGEPGTTTALSYTTRIA